MFESHPELDTAVDDLPGVPSPALSFVGIAAAVAVLSLITFALFI